MTSHRRRYDAVLEPYACWEASPCISLICIVLITGSNLKVIATMSVGTDHIDVRKCEDRNIFVARTPDVASDSAAELTVALILITIRRLGEGNKIYI